MKDILIHTDCSLWLEKHFKMDLVSLEDLIAEFEELCMDNDRLQEELEDLKQDLQDNYRPIPPEQQYD